MHYSRAFLGSASSHPISGREPSSWRKKKTSVLATLSPSHVLIIENACQGFRRRRLREEAGQDGAGDEPTGSPDALPFLKLLSHRRGVWAFDLFQDLERGFGILDGLGALAELVEGQAHVE
jgi:hypothetical protein